MNGLYQQSLVETLRQGVESLLAEWRLSPATRLSLLCISENVTFRADDPERDNPVVIRVHRPGYHEPDEIGSELGWIAALRAESVLRTPAPLHTRGGSLIVNFEHGQESRQVVAFEFMAGREPNASGDLRGGFRELGELTACLHVHARQWRRPPDFRRKTWNFETTLGARPHWGEWRKALGLTNEGEAVLERCVERLRGQLQAYGESPDRFGLIHADLRLANLLVDDERLAVIDFDDCGLGWYFYDFAAAISFIETSPQIPALQRAWLEGYRRVLALSAADEAAMPMFVMLRRLLLTAWIASHAETPTACELGGDYTQDTVLLAQNYLDTGQVTKPA